MGNDPRPGDGRVVSRQISRQTPGTAQNDAVHGAPHPDRRALEWGRGVREPARLLKVSAAKVSEVRRMSAVTAGLGLRRSLSIRS